MIGSQDNCNPVSESESWGCILTAARGTRDLRGKLWVGPGLLWAGGPGGWVGWFFPAPTFTAVAVALPLQTPRHGGSRYCRQRCGA